VPGSCWLTCMLRRELVANGTSFGALDLTLLRADAIPGSRPACSFRPLAGPPTPRTQSPLSPEMDRIPIDVIDRRTPSSKYGSCVGAPH
jgi:hypothetical protein